ncbi:hypothetical protein RUM44_004348 [Polyplax serrata]|uniref:Uncharacterized protein n=1 Tax=Polyplax serrata TaxID=468196 RepID=A0ABR1B2K5_POLSC
MSPFLSISSAQQFTPLGMSNTIFEKRYTIRVLEKESFRNVENNHEELQRTQENSSSH